MPVKRNFKYECEIESKGIENKNQNKLDCVSILLSDKNSQTKSFRVIKKETSQWQKGRLFYSLGRKNIILIFYGHPKTASNT